MPYSKRDFPSGAVVYSPSPNAGDPRDRRFDRWVGKISWILAVALVFLPRKLHRQRAWRAEVHRDYKELDRTE